MTHRFVSICLLILLTCLVPGCYRETGVEQLIVTATKVTDGNAEDLSANVEASGRIGDFILQSTNLQVVVQGSEPTPSRNIYLPMGAGSIIDFATRLESGLSRDLVSLNDDGILQITQGVNMNRNNLISYDRIRVDQEDAFHASLVLTGGVFDLDGSLAAAGAPVDPATRRVIDCEVTTILDLLDNLANEQGNVDQRVVYVTLTTAITNLTSQNLPIYTVNDIVVTQPEAANVFVSYPDWGYEIPARQGIAHAYAPYVQLQPRQSAAGFYSFFSLMDGLVMADREIVPRDNVELTYIGKSSTPDRVLEPGGAYTFIREAAIINGPSGLSSQTAYNITQSLIALNPTAGSIFTQTGGMAFAPNRRGGLGDYMVVEMIEGSVNYFNGREFVALEAGRTFPVFGEKPIAFLYGLTLPVGRVGVRIRTLHDEEAFVDSITRTSTDDNGDPVTTIERFDITLDGLYNLGTMPFARFDQATAGLAFADENQRTIFGRVTVEDNSGRPVETGTFPRANQGNFVYVNTTQSAAVTLQEGEYQLLGSHGPLYFVNIQDLSVGDVVVVEGDEENDPVIQFQTTPASIAYTLGRALTLEGYLSADFDVRASGDPMGLVDKSDLFLVAYAEDLDVLFFAETNHQSLVENEYNLLGSTLGPFDANDRENRVNSFLDEVAVSRATATIGKINGRNDARARFALLNLPREGVLPYLEGPLFESDPASYYDRVREIDPNILVHVTRPRAAEGFETGFFTTVAKLSGLLAGQAIQAENPYLQRTAETGSSTRWLDFDLLQVLSGNHYGEYLAARADWFNLLNADVFKPATGGSNPGATKDLPLGTVRTFVAVSDTALRDNDLQSFWQAAKAGAMFVTNGPIIEANVGGTSYGGTVSAAGGTVNLNLKVSAAPWIPVGQVRIVIDGQVQDIPIPLDDSEIVRFDATIPLTLPPGGRHWIVIEAGVSLAELNAGIGNSGTFGRVNPGHLPLAFTNPIFVQGGN